MRIAIMGAGAVGGYFGGLLSLAMHQSFPKTMYASMYHDVAKGKPMELDSLSGYIVRKGRELGVPTPVHEMAYLALKPYKDGAPKPLTE